MGRLVGALLLSCAVGGCAATTGVSDTLFVQPGKYHFLRCEDIAKRAAGAAAREKELTELMERANQSAAGPLINVTVYGAEFQQVRADRNLLARTAEEKNCPATSPAAPGENPPPAPKSR